MLQACWRVFVLLQILHIQALKLHINKAGYLFEGCYFVAIRVGGAEIAKIECLYKMLQFTIKDFVIDGGLIVL